MNSSFLKQSSRVVVVVVVLLEFLGYQLFCITMTVNQDKKYF